MPDLPTMAERECQATTSPLAGLAAPAGHARPDHQKNCYGEIARILATPERVNGSSRSALSPAASRPMYFAALVRTEYSKMGDVIRATGIKIE